MERKEALKILLKQIEDYDAWGSEICDCLFSKKDKCSHPYPMWFNKKDKPSVCSCMLCNKKLDFDKDISRNWKSFDKQDLVNKAIEIIKKEINHNLTRRGMKNNDKEM